MIRRATVIATAISLLAGCATPPESIATRTGVVEAQASVTRRALPSQPLSVTDATQGTAAAADAAAAAPLAVARRASKPWFGARMADVQSDEVLPQVFYQSQSIDFDDKASKGRVSIAVVAERLSRITGVPVRIKADVYAPVVASATTTRAPSAQPSAPPAPNMASPAPAPFGVGGPLPTLATGPAQAAGQPGFSAPSADSAVTLTYQQPVTDLTSVDMKWSGTLAAFLDHVTARLNLSWSFREGAVVIERFQTESFELTALAGEQDYRMAITSGTSGTSGSNGTSGTASSTVGMNEGGRSNILDSVRKTLEAMVSGTGGNVVINEGTGRIFVSAPRDVMTRVRELMRAEDASLQRQALIQIDVYSVLANDADEAGVDWNLVYRTLAQTVGGTIKSPTSMTSTSAGATGISILSNARWEGTSAVLSLLNQIGSSAQYRPVSLIALNRQWARKTNLRNDGYVSETLPSTSTSAGSGAPGLKTSTVVTGDKFLVQPAIMDNGTILLKFGVSLSELLGLFEVTAGSGASLQRVQTPVTSGTDDQATVKLQPGESMVVTGLSRRVATTDRRTLADGAPIVFGGSRKNTVKREDFLIVVRATQI